VISRRSEACLPDVSREVLRYLIQHPSANDTVEGIVQWWLLEQRIQHSLAEVRAAMAGLVASQLVVAHQRRDGRIYYQIDKRKKPEILHRLEAPAPGCALRAK